VDKEEAKEGESEWGKAADGVQVRLRLSKLPNGAPGSRDFSLDVRNQGDHDIGQCRVPNFCQVEWDGEWYTYPNRDLDCKAFNVAPGKQIDDWVKTSLDEPWERLPDRKAGDPPSIGSVRMKRLTVEPGKHTVRVAFVFNEKIRPVSQPVVFELGAESAWGEAVDGVQARIRTRKVVWTAGEAPTFHFDLRNQGNTKPIIGRSNYAFQPEVDKVWYVFFGVASLGGGNKLKPGEQVNDWTIVNLDKTWGKNGGETRFFPLAPGKHTVRIGCTFNGNSSDDRPISGPIDFEVVARPAPEVPLDGAKVPPAKEVAPPDAGDKQTAVRSAMNVGIMLAQRDNYELTNKTTLEKALDAELTQKAISWRVNDLAFAKQGEDASSIHNAPIGGVGELHDVTIKDVMELLISRIESKSDDGKAVAVVRPDGVEITTKRAYLDEFFPGRKATNLPPLVNAVFDEVPLAEALKDLSRTTKCNVVLAGDLANEGETKVTAHLTGVPLDTAIVILADMAGLNLVRLGNVYYVTSRERAGVLEKEERERRLEEETGKGESAKPPANKTDAKK
jgi:hypothetical protein